MFLHPATIASSCYLVASQEYVQRHERLMGVEKRTVRYRPEMLVRFVFPQANSGQRRTTMGHSSYDPVEQGPAWNAGKMLGAKRPLKPKEIWEIRFMLDREHRLRDRALLDLAIDSKLRGCDVVKVRIGDLVSGGRVRNRAMVIQQKTKRPVQFELLEPARSSILAWL